MCDLANDLRDATAEYQVSSSVAHVGEPTHDEVYSLRSRTLYSSRTVN